jgi:hypothetical protein
VGEVPGQLVLQSQFFFLQPMEKVFVGMRSMFFLFDEGVERCVLRFQFLGYCLVHWCHSFRLLLSPPRNKTRIAQFVLMLSTARRVEGAGRRWSPPVPAAADLG